MKMHLKTFEHPRIHHVLGRTPPPGQNKGKTLLKSGVISLVLVKLLREVRNPPHPLSLASMANLELFLKVRCNHNWLTDHPGVTFTHQNRTWMCLPDLENDLTLSIPIICQISHPSVYYFRKKNTQLLPNWLLFTIIYPKYPGVVLTYLDIRGRSALLGRFFARNP